MLVLVPTKANPITKKQSCKWGIVDICDIKMIFELLEYLFDGLWIWDK